MSSPQLVVRLAALGRPQQLAGLLDVVVPSVLKDGDVLYYSANTSNFTLGSLSFVDGANTIIKLKRANTTSLSDGELYYSFADKKLYIGNSTNHLVTVAGEYYIDLANSIFFVSNLAFAQANTARVHANAAHLTANSGFVHANAAFAQANAGLLQANSGFVHANAAFAQANAGLLQANTARVHANTAHASANSGLEQANTARIHANVAFAQANAGLSQANTARVHANVAFEQANTARDLANTKFSSTGGVITGDVSIVGSLILSGNTSFVNVSTYAVSDPLLYLASNNYSSDIVDIGFIANYVNATGQNVHTGFYREHTTKEYYIFQEYNKEPDNNHIDPNANGFTLSVLNAAIRTSNLLLAGTNTVVWIRGSYDQANAARTHANTAHISANAGLEQANTARDHANVAFAQANTARVHANTAHASANSGLEQANTARVHANTSHATANAAFEQANTARIHANTAHASANAGLSQANTARDHANTAHISANAGLSQANTARDHANVAFAQANTARDHANSSFSRANTIYDVANTKLNLSGGTIAGDLVVSGNITVSGQTTYANTIRLLIGDNILTLNADLPAAFAPSENAGLEINRGSSANTYLLWNEGIGNWTFTNNGTTYFNIPTNTAVELAVVIGQSAFGQANTTRDHANTAHATANAAFGQANTARVHANAAFTTANAALPNVSGSVFNGNLIVSANLNAGIVRVNDGSNTVPSVSFANANTTGIYRTSNNRLGFTVAGEDVLYLSNTLANTAAFEILDANNEAIFSVNDVSSGNILELYDIFTSNTIVFSVDSNQLYVRDRINVNSYLTLTANTRVAPSNVQIELTRFSANTFSGGKFIILGKQGSNTHISELSVVHNIANVFFTEYGIVFSSNSLFTTTASLNTNNVIVSVIPTSNAITTFTIVENRLIV